MRIKTFIATYALFLLVMFASVGIVSAYLTNSQLRILQEKGEAQYRTIAAAIVRDMAALTARNFPQVEFEAAVYNVMVGYQMYYARHRVAVGLVQGAYTPHDISLPALVDISLTFVEVGRLRLISISGILPYPFHNFRLDYTLDITENIADMQSIQNILLVSVTLLSAVAAVALYFVLAAIFRPFGIVASASRKIAGGQFGERIHVEGDSEISRLAQDFNNMAQKIEGQIRQLEDEAVAKQQFVDNFAHEIRTPLTSIYGYAEFMQKTKMDEQETLESAEYIMSESRHMRNIANSLLELAVLRDYVPVKGEIGLAALFAELEKSLEGRLKAQGAKLEIAAEMLTIHGQEDLLKSLLMNLCTNAINACKKGEGVVRLTAAENVLSVSDNGCGIPLESIPKLVDPFYRVDNARSRDHGGTGLGLALCQQIANVHGATMTVESVLGEGTTVAVILA